MAVSREAAEVLTESRDEWMVWMKKGIPGASLPVKEKPQAKPKSTARRAGTRKAV